MRPLRPIALLTAAVLVALPPMRAASFSWAPISSQDAAKALALNSPDNHTRYERLHKMFELAGCQERYLQELRVSHAPEPDLVCTLPGALTPAAAPDPQRIVVVARYDHIGKGSGSVDNWSGAAMLPLLFATDFPGYREHTIQFVATYGSSGLHTFLKTLKSREKASILALVDLRDIGMESMRLAFLTNQIDVDNTIAEGRGTIRSGLPHTVNTVDPPKRPIVGAPPGMPTRDPRLTAMHIADTVTKTGAPPMSDPYVDSFMSARPQTAKDEVQLILDSDIPGVVIHSITKANAAIPGTEADKPETINQIDYYSTYYYTAVYLLVLDHPQAATEFEKPR
jgi:hypothetical protein